MSQFIIAYPIEGINDLPICIADTFVEMSESLFQLVGKRILPSTISRAMDRGGTLRRWNLQFFTYDTED